MRIVMSDGHGRRYSEPLIAHVAAHLGKFGIEVERVRARKEPRQSYEEYAALIANTEFPFELRERLDCFGKSSTNMPSRPETMEWLRDAGLPTMRWSLAGDHLELDRLFDVWKTDAILIKRSGSWGGTSVSMFSRERAAEIEWNPPTDLFCPEVNPHDGDVYKLEMFGRDLLLGWFSRVPSARTRMSGGKVDGIFGAYGRRALFDWSESILQPARKFGDFARDRGYGHISLDLMLNPDGEFEVIEVNLGNVAIWWTSQFRSFRRRYACAIHRLLVERHGAPANVAGLSTRLRFRLAELVQQPKLLVREVQGAWSRWRNTRDLEARNAAPTPTERR